MNASEGVDGLCTELEELLVTTERICTRDEKLKKQTACMKRLEEEITQYGEVCALGEGIDTESDALQDLCSVECLINAGLERLENLYDVWEKKCKERDELESTLTEFLKENISVCPFCGTALEDMDIERLLES